MHLDNLSNQSLVTNTHNVEHVGIPHSFCDNQRSCYFFNRTCTHLDESPTFPSLFVSKDNIRSYRLFYRLLDAFYAGSGIAGYSWYLDNRRNSQFLIFLYLMF